MKFVISQSELLDSLKIVSRAVSGNNTLPVLGNILIRVEPGKVFFAATNLDISITTASDAEVLEEGAVTVPAKILTSYISLIKSSEEVEVELIDGITLSIKTKTSKTKIKGIAADEFPDISEINEGISLKIEAKEFKEAVGDVAFAAQENASRPILSGVFFTGAADKLALVATDSYRLSEKKIQLENSIDEVSCIIPVRSVLEAERLIGGNEFLEVLVSENQVLFEFGSTKLISRLIDGNFPDYKQIIPKSHNTTVILSQKELSLAVRRVAIFAKENNQHMKLEFLETGTLAVFTDSTQIGEDRTEISVEINGSSNVIALNADYVLDLLSAMGHEDKIKIEMEGKLSPAVFKAEKSENFVHLIMPLKM